MIDSLATNSSINNHYCSTCSNAGNNSVKFRTCSNHCTIRQLVCNQPYRVALQCLGNCKNVEALPSWPISKRQLHIHAIHVEENHLKDLFQYCRGSANANPSYQKLRARLSNLEIAGFSQAGCNALAST